MTRPTRGTHEEGARLDGFHTRAITGAAFLWLTARCASGALTSRTGVRDAHVDVFVAAAHGFLKG